MWERHTKLQQDHSTCYYPLIYIPWSYKIAWKLSAQQKCNQKLEKGVRLFLGTCFEGYRAEFCGRSRVITVVSKARQAIDARGWVEICVLLVQIAITTNINRVYLETIIQRWELSSRGIALSPSFRIWTHCVLETISNEKYNFRHRRILQEWSEFNYDAAESTL